MYTVYYSTCGNLIFLHEEVFLTCSTGTGTSYASYA
jgi:hypothetical protein